MPGNDIEDEIPDFLSTEPSFVKEDCSWEEPEPPYAGGTAEIIPAGELSSVETVPRVPVTIRMAARDIAEEMGITADPIRYMLSVVANGNEGVEKRLDAAKSVAGYLYPKLSAVAVAGTESRSLEDFLDSIAEPEQDDG